MKKSLGADTILYTTPVLVIATYDKKDVANAMTAAWGGICCSKPPCIAVSLRSATYSHGNIIEHKAFTVNIPSEKHVKEADYFGMASGRNENKIKKSGLTAVKSEIVDAPYIKEFPLVLECQLKEIVEVGLHTQFIGEIKDVKADKNVIKPDGTLDVGKIKPFVFLPDCRGYYGLGKKIAQAFSVGRL